MCVSVRAPLQKVLLAVLSLAAISAGSIVKAPGETFELLILHNNDMHARFEQTSQLSGACTTADREAGKCYGGFPRVAHVVKEARRAAHTGEGPPVLYLNAGDTYTGTAWFTIYKWRIAAEFVNALQPDAVSLGNNEIEEQDISPLLQNLKTEILACNVIIKSAENKVNIKKSAVFDINGVKVGIVGYLTPEGNNLGDLEYIDEVLAITEEVEKLQASNVKIIIALGHSTLAKEMEIAKEVAGLDLIIAGNKNMFYWNGTTVSEAQEKPIVVTQKSGKEVPIVSSTAYNKYLGSLTAKFTEDGELAEYIVDPILLDATVPEDPTYLQMRKAFASDTIAKFERETLGNTAVVLDGKSCSLEECNFGNFVADAVAYYYALQYKGDYWTDAPVAIVHSGAFADSIAPASRPAPVSRADILTAMPLESNLVTLIITGSGLIQILEHSVSDYNDANSAGRFLQFSGIRAVFDLEQPSGSRLVEAVVRCASCNMPQFFSVVETATYKVIVPAELANGGYGYSMLVPVPRVPLPYDLQTCTAESIKQRTPVYPEVAGRIVLNSASTFTSSILLSLGNHEFDHGLAGLIPFLQNVTCPVLASNLILTKEPELQAQSNLMNSVVIDMNGTKIGIIGYLTPETKSIAVKNQVEFINEVIAVGKEATMLKNNGVNILIALGHSGYLMDMEIAKRVEDIDLVIGGHSHTLLWNGTAPDVEVPEGKYPTVVAQESGRLVPVVQAYAYTKYLGKLLLTFDKNGEIIKYEGKPLVLDNSVPEDPTVLKIVDRYREDITKLTEEVIGNTSVIIDGESCRLKECTMGNVITDAMIHRYASVYDGLGWTDAPIAILHGGGIRSSFHYSKLPSNITKGEVIQVLPFDATVIKVDIVGADILKMLEHSVDNYNERFPTGEFLQMSGMKVVYELENPPTHRVKSVHSLGNHELDNGVSGLTPFVKNLTCPVLAANLVLTQEPELQSEKNLMNSVIFDVNGRQVGIIGYLTPETKVLAIRNNVDYIEEVTAIRQEVAKLKNKGVKILIALGHSGFEKDLEIAKEVEDIDLVIGGHTNTFLYNGTSPDTENSEGPYPTLVKQKNGRLVPAVQAYAYTKYLGKLHLTFDSDGELISSYGNPILLDNSIPQDPEVLEIVERYRKDITQITETVVGNTSIVLEGQTCRLIECNMGNLIADAIIHRYASEYRGFGWTDAPIAVIQGGGIRASIAHNKLPANITKGDLLRVLPFDGLIVKGRVNGSIIFEMLEHSVSKYNPSYAPGQFLQMSGMMVVYDLAKPPGSRVVRVYTRCGECLRPEYNLMNATDEYNILMPAFLSMGGDGFSMLNDINSTILDYNELDSVEDYIIHHSPMYPSIEGRIIIKNLDKLSNSASNFNLSLASMLALFFSLASLGNHEFDNGVSGLTPFIRNLTCPVLAANLILTKVPELAEETNLKKSVVLEVAGRQVGVVGYLTPDTKVLAVPNDVEYRDEIEALREEVKELQNQGINIIIAVGHSGYLKDLEIAKKVPGVDLVIGGHTNTFLWNGTSPDSELSIGHYPTYVTQASGRRVPVVQAYAYTKYLGKLHMVFDSNGELISADGMPFILDQTIPQDEDVLQIINRYRGNILNITEEVLGNTSVILDSTNCQIDECNIGNLITDAMVFRYASEYTGEHWTDAPIAIIQGGGIRSSIAHAKMPTNLTKGDLLEVMPFDGRAVTVTVNGSILLQMIEHSVANYNLLEQSGEFLQYSGIKVMYDLSKPSGSRIVKAEARCWACSSLGNHEFDEAVDGVVPFIRNLSSPVLAANLDLNKVPELEAESNLYKSIVLVKNNVRIGIIGYLTPETKYLAPMNDVEYIDEVPAIREEVKKLKDRGINILIALGHSGFMKDLEIARDVKDLDLVIGGHSNTFLWNANTTSEKPEEPQGPYPTEIKQADGRVVRVVQAYAYTKYMGKLHLIFDSAGEIIKCDGTPILLDKDVPRDPELIEIIDKYRNDVDRINNEVVGSSLVYLNGDCRLRECNLGDLITDAMLNYTREKYHDQYPDVNIALVQGGRIRTSIDHSTTTPGQEPTPFTLTRGDWITVLPFSDTLAVVTMNGSILRQSLEHSVSTWRVIDSTGQFQQLSGMEVAYDLSRPVGSRVVKARAVCSNCGSNELQDIVDEYEYKMMMPTFLANGGDGYSIFMDLPKETVSYNELDSVLYYLSKYSPVDVEVDGRIKVLNEDKIDIDTSNVRSEGRRSNSGTTVVPNWFYVLTTLVLIQYSFKM
ncbi:unnamed protein product [Chrysodeixis includens]|uniref:5'-nucleotidase n=1 Tax=Chrysodeixis includens TaxID=689277 RepID=A0A9N8KUB3_CHRIL|nr:unnamed protein product [Chrysodeixis includens]